MKRHGRVMMPRSYVLRSNLIVYEQTVHAQSNQKLTEIGLLMKRKSARITCPRSLSLMDILNMTL